MKAISEKNTAVRRKTAVKSAGTAKPAAKKASPKVAKKSAATKPKLAAKPKAATKPKAAAKAKAATKPKAKTATKTAAKAKAPKAPVAKTAQAASKADAFSRQLLKLVEKSLDDDKAEDIVSVDLAGKSAIADFMVIATGRNVRQLAAMAHHVAEKLSKAGAKPINIEGISQGDWVLVDGNDIIIHLFRPDVRKLYSLEKMWGLDQVEPEKLHAVG
ncbi:ribosome silencing factor [Dongia rigui]|uniref:Ribosomal silencing factor RsfS n=1 Tax=Dongia rigui TaxID=940149 RepID=A0ABU5DTM9_9PROT|nr:ribosome silencing factor [Dongia rigui]MDY0870675.1 ribosome silencing factor [Dongia rigui]